MKKLKRILCLMIIVAMMTSMVASCSEKDPNNGSGKDTTAVSTNNTENVDSETTDIYDPKLPDKNFEGSEFKIMTKDKATYNEWGEVSIYAESENGEVINDAVFTRNRTIEEKYNVKIKEVLSSNLISGVEKSVMAADGAFDVAMPSLNDAGSISAKGHLVDLNTVPYLNFEQPWWDQRAAKDLSINNKLYFMSGDISMLNNDATWCTVFNKNMLAENDLESPYKLVQENKWTMDKFYEMCANVSGDINGDSKIDYQDKLANLTQNENALAMYIGGGERLTAKDENDIPIPVMASSERSVKVFDEMFKIMTDENISLNYHNYSQINPQAHLVTTQMFEENRGLFWITNLQLVIRLRSMETPFGIVPVPKYDSTQETYSNVVWFVGSYVTVPQTTPDIEKTGFLLEAMCAESMRTLRPAYYDISLNGKYLRDEESIGMLDLIIENRTYELAQAYKWGSVDGILEGLVSKKSNTFSSTYEKSATKIQKAIEKTIEKLNKNV